MNKGRGELSRAPNTSHTGELIERHSIERLTSRQPRETGIDGIADRNDPCRLGCGPGGRAVYNIYRTRKVEHDHPPTGRFITVDGVRLHYLEKGEGPPVVLIHGNVVTAEDFVLSGVFDRVARNHRVIAIDRPGYGYSERPQGSIWTAIEQADLLLEAFYQLGIERPIVVGHSWGTLVAMELALGQPDAVSGLVLLGGYYSRRCGSTCRWSPRRQSP